MKKADDKRIIQDSSAALVDVRRRLMSLSRLVEARQKLDDANLTTQRSFEEDCGREETAMQRAESIWKEAMGDYEVALGNCGVAEINLTLKLLHELAAQMNDE